MEKEVIVYCVIVTHNSTKNNWINTCLTSLRKSSINIKVLVVDNSSSDNTVELIRNKYSEVELFEENDNLGFGAANNIGMSYALKNNADYVFLLNQDAYVKPETIERLVKASTKYPEYGIISPIHLNGKGDKLDRNFSYYLNYDKNSSFYGDFIQNRVKDIYDVPFVNAAAWLLPISTLETIGGFDPIFHHYGEDDNYCQRVRYQKLKVGVASNSFICHDREHRKEKSITIFSNQYNINYERELKGNYADINRNFGSNEKTFIKKRSFINILKSILRFRVKSLIGYYKQFNQLNSIFFQIEISRTKNLKRTSNYL